MAETLSGAGGNGQKKKRKKKTKHQLKGGGKRERKTPVTQSRSFMGGEKRFTPIGRLVPQYVRRKEGKTHIVSNRAKGEE